MSQSQEEKKSKPPSFEIRKLVCMTPFTLNYSKIWGKREGEGLVSTIKGLSANLERV